MSLEIGKSGSTKCCNNMSHLVLTNCWYFISCLSPGQFRKQMLYFCDNIHIHPASNHEFDLKNGTTQDFKSNTVTILSLNHLKFANHAFSIMILNQCWNHSHISTLKTFKMGHLVFFIPFEIGKSGPQYFVITWVILSLPIGNYLFHVSWLDSFQSKKYTFCN